MMGLKARKEPNTPRTRRADLRGPLQSRPWGWGAAVVLTVLCCSLGFTAAGRTVDDALPGWVRGALQQAAKFLTTRAEQIRPQETPPVILGFDVSPNASGSLTPDIAPNHRKSQQSEDVNKPSGSSDMDEVAQDARGSTTPAALTPRPGERT